MTGAARKPRFVHVTNLRRAAIESIKRTGSVECALCLKPIRYVADVSIDHIKPKALGGTGNPDNLQITHYKCNLQKGNRYIE